MPSRKQRRKREKLQRHEYEYVLETEDGEEILERPTEVAATEKNGKPRKAVAGPVDRHGKPIQKPSFRRVLRRTAIFAPVMAIVVYLLIREEAGNVLATVVFQTLLLLAFFMPLSYVVDTFVYRMLWRRYEKEKSRAS
jgi:hypothetical protein